MPHLIHFINRREYLISRFTVFVRKQSQQISVSRILFIFIKKCDSFSFPYSEETNAAICVFQCLWNQRSRHRQQNWAGYGNYLFCMHIIIQILLSVLWKALHLFSRTSNRSFRWNKFSNRAVLGGKITYTQSIVSKDGRRSPCVCAALLLCAGIGSKSLDAAVNFCGVSLRIKFNTQNLCVRLDGMLQSYVYWRLAVELLFLGWRSFKYFFSRSTTDAGIYE